MYVVVGGSGYLGGYFLKNLLARKENEKIIATYNREPGAIKDARIEWLPLNISSPDSIDAFVEKLSSYNCKFSIFYLSASHHPDEVLKNFDRAWGVNITGLSYFLTHMKNIDTLYYSSTEMVYGESLKGKIYTENDTLNPINAYGKQKAIAEQLVLGKGYNVVRFSVLMGVGINGKEHFTDKIISSIKTKQGIEMLKDTYRNMIDFNQASEFTIELCEKYGTTQIGITNVVSDNVISKYDMAIKLADDYKLDKQYVKGITLDENTFYSASRAKILMLSNQKLKYLLGVDKINIKFN